MGNHGFRVSDMMPNAWFYKLRDMSSHSSRRRTPRRIQASASSAQAWHPRHHSSTGSPMTLRQHISMGSPSRNTKALDIHLPPSPPRRSLTRRNYVYKPSILVSPRIKVASPCSDHRSSAAESLPSSDPFDEEVGSWSSSCSPSSTADIIFDIHQKSPPSAKMMLDMFDHCVSLPPILTKKDTSKYKPEPTQGDALHQEIRKALHQHHRSLSIQLSKHETDNKRRQQRTRKEKEPRRKSLVKVRGRNPPRLVTANIREMRVIQGSKAIRGVSSSKSSISESLAVIKCSYEPEKDFRDSMMEMIKEHHIQASKDLEELLACYLTLNSNDYHHLIVKAFEQVWCDMFSSTPVFAAELAGDVNRSVPN